MNKLPQAHVVVDHDDFVVDFARNRKRRASVAFGVGVVAVGVSLLLWAFASSIPSPTHSASVAENRNAAALGWAAFGLQLAQWGLLIFGVVVCLAAIWIYVTPHRGVRAEDDVD